VVALYLALSNELIALITPELTGGVVAVSGDGVAAVHATPAEICVVQSWTLFNCKRQ